MHGRKASQVALALAFAIYCVVGLSFAPSGVTAEAASPLDPSFGRGGVVVVPTPRPSWNGSALAVTEDRQGRFVATGETVNGFGLMRFLPDGTLDTSFGTSQAEAPAGGSAGLVSTGFGEQAGASAIAETPDGGLVAVGGPPWGGAVRGFLALARYRPDGTLDRSFGGDGRVVEQLGFNGGSATGLAIQADRKTVVAGTARAESSRAEGLLVRYRRDGSVDRAFGDGGEVRIRSGGGRVTVQALDLLPGGKLLVAGQYDGHFMLVRLLSDGRFDPGFGRRGRALLDVDGDRRCFEGICAAIQDISVSGSKIVAVGTAADAGGIYSTIARFRRDGRLDMSFGDRGRVKIRRGVALYMRQVVATGRDIIVAGDFQPKATGSTIEVRRYRLDGSLDRHFARRGVFSRRVGYASGAYGATLDKRGRLVIAGFAAIENSPSSFDEPRPFENLHYLLLRLRP